MFKPFACKSSSWGRTIYPQEDCPGVMERGHGTLSSTITPIPQSKTWEFASPVYTRYPLMSVASPGH